MRASVKVIEFGTFQYIRRTQLAIVNSRFIPLHSSLLKHLPAQFMAFFVFLGTNPLQIRSISFSNAATNRFDRINSFLSVPFIFFFFWFLKIFHIGITLTTTPLAAPRMAQSHQLFAHRTESYSLCQYDYVKWIAILIRYFVLCQRHDAKDYIKRIAILICYFACSYANIMMQVRYKLVNPWLPWQCRKHPRRSISTSQGRKFPALWSSRTSAGYYVARSVGMWHK